MSKHSKSALLGACALLGVMGAAGSASAQTSPTTIYGGGSSLIAPYWRQSGDCYGVAVNLYQKTGSSTAPTQITTNAPPSSCTPGTNTVQYISTGSGTGIATVYSHDNTLYGPPAGMTSGSIFPTVNYGNSDNSLIAADLTVYNSGGTEQGLTFGASGSGATYPIPKSVYGPLVQFPISVDPVALAYNPVYKTSGGTSYSLQVKSPSSDGSGGLPISQVNYCAIFNGQITDWGDPGLTNDNGGQSLKASGDTGAAPIHINGRSDSSGTTSIFTRHLANVCAALAGTTLANGQTLTNTYSTGSTTLSGAGVNSTVLALYTLSSGSGGVATSIHNTPGAIGYLGPDYALPAVTNTGANTYNLNVAKLQNSSGAFEPPNATTASTAFGSISPPTGSAQADPTAWVQSTAPTAPLANPSAAAAYPIVGTTNFLGYTCYANANTLAVVKAFVNFDLTNTNAKSILSSAGLSALPTNWQNTIVSAFVTGNAQNVEFAQAGSGSANAACTVSGVTGG